MLSTHYGLSQCQQGSWWPDCSVTVTGVGKGEPKSTTTKQASCKERSVYLVQEKQAESKPGGQNKANISDKGQAGIRSPRQSEQESRTGNAGELGKIQQKTIWQGSSENGRVYILKN